MAVKQKELNEYRIKLLTRFSSVLPELHQVCSQLSKGDWKAAVSGEKTTPQQAIARLEAKQTGLYTSCILGLLDGNKQGFPTFDAQSWLENEYREDIGWEEVLENFVGEYQQVIDRVASMDAGKWSVYKRHPWHGEKTLQWWVECNLASVAETLKIIRKAVEK